MSSIYEKAVYKRRKEYMASYYQEHKEDLARKAHERYVAKKKLAMKQREIEYEDIKTQICSHYCKYTDIWDEEKEGCKLSESERCANCPLHEII